MVVRGWERGGGWAPNSWCFTALLLQMYPIPPGLQEVFSDFLQSCPVLTLKVPWAYCLLDSFCVSLKSLGHIYMATHTHFQRHRELRLPSGPVCQLLSPPYCWYTTMEPVTVSLDRAQVPSILRCLNSTGAPCVPSADTPTSARWLA